MGAFASCIAFNLCECAACMACSCCSSVINATLSQAARFGHLLVLLLTFILAIILGKSYPNDVNGYNYYTKVDLTSDCNEDYQENCIYRQLIYRASFSLCLLFFLLSILSYYFDYVNKSFWIVKFGFAIGVFIAFWWADNSFFNGWAEFCRVISFIWLLIQGLLLIDFSHDIHDIFMAQTDSNNESSTPYIIYVAVSICALFLAILGLVYLFMDYTGCDLGMFFTILTLLVGVITTIISLLDSVSRGLLTPCFLFAYSVFMCWYALLSHPDTSCNPTADKINGSLNVAVVIVAAVSTVILLYCVVNGTKILNIFNPSGEGVLKSYGQDTNNSQLFNTLTGDTAVTKQPGNVEMNSASNSGLANDNNEEKKEEEKSSGTPHERAFYHVILFLVCAYGSMILTNWGKSNGTPTNDGSHRIADESMWLKIVSQWIFLILYIKILHVAYTNNLE